MVSTTTADLTHAKRPPQSGFVLTGNLEAAAILATSYVFRQL